MKKISNAQKVAILALVVFGSAVITGCSSPSESENNSQNPSNSEYPQNPEYPEYPNYPEYPQYPEYTDPNDPYIPNTPSDTKDSCGLRLVIRLPYENDVNVGTDLSVTAGLFSSEGKKLQGFSMKSLDWSHIVITNEGIDYDYFVIDFSENNIKNGEYTVKFLFNKRDTKYAIVKQSVAIDANGTLSNGAVHLTNFDITLEWVDGKVENPENPGEPKDTVPQFHEFTLGTDFVIDKYNWDGENITIIIPEQNTVDLHALYELHQQAYAMASTKGKTVAITRPSANKIKDMNFSAEFFIDELHEIKENGSSIFEFVTGKKLDAMSTLTKDDLPNLTLDFSRPARGEKTANLYGTNIDKIIELYYSKAKDKFNISWRDGYFDAKDYLEGKTMYEGNEFKRAYSVDINVAILMRVALKNVRIDGTNSTGKTIIQSLTNVYVDKDTSLAGITEIGSSYGIIEFAGAAPQITPVAEKGKIILHKVSSLTNVNRLNTLDILGLDSSSIGKLRVGGMSLENLGVRYVYTTDSKSSIGKSSGIVQQIYTKASDGPTNQAWEQAGREQKLPSGVVS